MNKSDLAGCKFYDLKARSLTLGKLTGTRPAYSVKKHIKT